MSKVILLCSMLILTGCPKSWYFSIIDITDPSHPEFCVSSKKYCEGEVDLAIIDITEVNRKGENIKTMWIVEPKTKSQALKVKYGLSPIGWAQSMEAIPLEVGKLYSINGQHFFTLKKVNQKIEAEIYNLADFLEKDKEG